MRTHNNAESGKNSGRETELNEELIKKKFKTFCNFVLFN